MYNAYSVVNTKNRDAVDVDAFVGDTAVYFIKRGAHKVLAIEPHPRAFMIANPSISQRRITATCTATKQPK